MLDQIPVEKITAWDADFQEHLQSQQGALLEEISKGVMTKELDEKSTFFIGRIGSICNQVETDVTCVGRCRTSQSRLL
jgi:hypothetical protein